MSPKSLAALARKRVAVFDSDGTLVDSRAAHRSFYGRLKSELGLGPLSAREEDFVFISTQEQIIEGLVPEELRPEARGIAPGLRLRFFDPLVRLQPGLIPFLDRLRERGLRLAVNTNAGAEVARIHEGLGLSPYFEAVVTADDVVRPKPDPEGVGLILERFGVSPSESLFVGDSIIDQQTAANAGLSFWAFNNPALRADLHLADYGSWG